MVLQHGNVQYAYSFIQIDLYRIFQISKTCTILSTDFKIMIRWLNSTKKRVTHSSIAHKAANKPFNTMTFFHLKC